MLSLWPNLFDYQFFAPTILRLGLALALLWNGWQRRVLAHQGLTPGKKWLWLAIFEWLLAAFNFVGLFSQPVAVVTALWSVGQIKKQPIFSLLATAIALALLLIGPGALAFDFPL